MPARVVELQSLDCCRTVGRRLFRFIGTSEHIIVIPGPFGAFSGIANAYCRGLLGNKIKVIVIFRYNCVFHHHRKLSRAGNRTHATIPISLFDALSAIGVAGDTSHALPSRILTLEKRDPPTSIGATEYTAIDCKFSAAQRQFTVIGANPFTGDNTTQCIQSIDYTDACPSHSSLTTQPIVFVSRFRAHTIHHVFQATAAILDCLESPIEKDALKGASTRIKTILWRVDHICD